MSTHVHAVPCRTCDSLDLRNVHEVMEIGAAMVHHTQQASCGVEAMLAYPLDASQRLRAAPEAV